MNVPAIGSTCLGIAIGWLTRYLLVRLDKFNAQVLGAISSFLLGGAVVGFFSLAEPDKSVVWFYPIGILAGFVIYSVAARLSGAPARGSIYYVKKREDTNMKKDTD